MKMSSPINMTVVDSIVQCHFYIEKEKGKFIRVSCREMNGSNYWYCDQCFSYEDHRRECSHINQVKQLTQDFRFNKLSD